MHEEPETQQLHGRTQDQAIAEVLCKLRDIYAERETANPPSEPPTPDPDPWADKPGSLIAAEKDAWLCELVERLQQAWCARPGGCGLGRCKRARRCAELESLRPMIEQSRAALAAAQARWPRPTPPAQPLARRRGGEQRA
ncbi:MAG: hypothetical protein WAN86_25055 [Hyphomicrobiaceae bacterium]